MTTVGYGDIIPVNPYEIALCTSSMFVATAIFSYSFNSIGVLVQSIAKSNDEF